MHNTHVNTDQLSVENKSTFDQIPSLNSSSPSRCRNKQAERFSIWVTEYRGTATLQQLCLCALTAVAIILTKAPLEPSSSAAVLLIIVLKRRAALRFTTLEDTDNDGAQRKISLNWTESDFVIPPSKCAAYCWFAGWFISAALCFYEMT